MSDCFDNVNPVSCQGLGTKLQIVAGFNGHFAFDVPDWEIFSDCSYQLTLTADTHGRGLFCLAQVQKLVAGIYEEVGIEKIWELDGTLHIRVPRNVDCRFAGRIIIDG